MSLQNLSPGAFVAGLAALAATLFLLQRLRVRHRPQRVVTTLFWKEALEEARARVLVRRFRHPLAYALLVLIAGLLWLGFAEPISQGADQRSQIVLLDASAAQAQGQRWRDSKKLLEERVADLPREQRRVILCGAQTHTLLLPGEHELALKLRLEGRKPEPCPASVESCLRSLLLSGEAQGAVLTVVGNASVSDDFLALLPEGTSFERLGVPPGPGTNRGITQLGMSRAASGDYGRVDVLVVVRGSGAPIELELSLGDRPLDVQATREDLDDGQRIFLRDVPARGEELVVRLTGSDSLAADNQARLQLPDLPLIRVALSTNLDPSLRGVLASDPALLEVSRGAQVAVRLKGETVGGDVPALELVPEASQQEAILLSHEASLDSEDVLRSGLERLGLDEVDAMELAQASGRVIALGARPARQRGIGVWASLLSARYDFVQSRSFPLFVALALRWLARAPDFPAHVAAAEPALASPGPWQDEAGHSQDPVGVAFVPARAGLYKAPDGRRLAVSLLDAASTLPAARTQQSRADDASSGSLQLDLATLLMALVLGLSLLEWFLFRSGRIP